MRHFCINKRFGILLVSIVEDEGDYESAEDIMSDFSGGAFEVEWNVQRDVRCLEDMISAYKNWL